MAPSQCSISRMPSRCAAETARATVAFEIAGYSLLKRLGRGKCVRFPAFSVGGYEWCIRYHPNSGKTQVSEGHVSVYLELLSKDAEVRAIVKFMLVEPVGGKSIVVCPFEEPLVFDPKSTSWGVTKFMKTTTEVESVYLIKETLKLHVPPSHLLDNLAKLLEGKKGADVTFKVQGFFFSAHKVLLAMQSAVFDAEFYGPMGDKGAQDIIIDDMQPAVFKAFLHFIYTDSMPSMDGLEDDDKREMVKHLLVAADKYAMERMKMICEGMLCKGLDVENVATLLALADQYNCRNLKDSCIKFMISSDRVIDVIASQGYAQLKRSSPDIIVDVLERAAKSRKI